MIEITECINVVLTSPTTVIIQEVESQIEQFTSCLSLLLLSDGRSGKRNILLKMGGNSTELTELISLCVFVQIID